jgi:thioredoxin 2
MNTDRTCAACGARNRVPASRLGQRGKCGSCAAELPAAEAPVEVGEAAFDEVVLSSKVPVIVDFWSPTCGPCRVVAPELAKVAKRKSGGVLVAKVNTHADPGLAQRFDIEAVPTLILFQGGREVRRVLGAMPADRIERSLGV